MDQYAITSSEEPDQAAADVIHAGLLAFNEDRAGPAHSKKVQLILRDSNDVVRGGLLGRQSWGWLLVDILWVDEPLRGAGLGTQLLQQAEAEAQEAGCSRAVLDTFEFQALPFYQRPRLYSVRCAGGLPAELSALLFAEDFHDLIRQPRHVHHEVRGTLDWSNAPHGFSAREALSGGRPCGARQSMV